MRRLTITMLGILNACSPGGGGGDTSQPSANDAPGDGEDLAVVEPVPMALLGGDFLAEAQSALSSSGCLSYNKLSDSSAATRTPTVNQRDDNLALAKQILQTPDLATGELCTLLGQLIDIDESLFGKKGVFGTDISVVLPQGQKTGSRKFKLSGVSIDFAEIFANGSNATYPYAIDLYKSADDENVERVMRIEFAPLAEQADAVKAHVIFVGSKDSEGKRQHIEATYSTVEKSIATIFGTLPEVATIPSKTLAQLDLDSSGKSALVQGAFVWGDTGLTVADNTLAPARYYYPKKGDIETFRGRSRIDLTLYPARPAVQEIAFLSSDSLSTTTYQPDATIFSAYSYDKMMMDYLVSIVRTSAVNATCATDGAQFKSVMASATPIPDWVSTAPDNLCTSNAQVTDALVSEIIQDTCDAGVTVSVNVKLSGETSSSQMKLCAPSGSDLGKYYEALVLRNPQYLATDTSTHTRTLLSAASKTTEHDTLYSELSDHSSFLDLTPLESWQYIEEILKAKSYFGAAEPAR